MEFEFSRRKTDIKQAEKGGVSVTLFGSFNVTNKLQQSFNIVDTKAKAIFSLLCLSPQQTMDRNTLTELLWPGRFTAQAKSSLRQSILKLSKVFEAEYPDLLQTSRNNISLNQQFFTTDLMTFEDAILSGDIDQALIQAKRCKSLNIIENISVNEKFDAYTQRIIEQVEADIETKILKVKSVATNEQALIGAHQLQKLWQARRALQNTLPIAVLPFGVLPANTSQSYIGQGITDEVIYLLGQIPQLQVIGRRSSFLIANTDKSVQEIASTLKVEYLIEGTVRIDGDTIKINIQLVNGKTAFQEWAGQYEGDVHKFFALQETVATNLLNELEDTLGLKLVIPKINQMTVSQKAYDLYLQGRSLTKRIFGEGVLESAINLFEQALELDERFSECWAALAEANAYVMAFTPCLDRRPYLERLAKCAETALAIDPNCGLALVMKGVCLWEQNKPCEALKLAYKAYEVSPNDAAVVGRLGSFLSYLGYSQKALPFVAKAVSLDPLDGRHLVHLLAVLLNLGKVDEAIEVGHKATMVGAPSITLAYATFVKGDHELAVRQYSQTRLMMNAVMNAPSGERQMTEAELDEYWKVVSRGVCSGKEEDREKYCRLLAHMFTTVPDRYDAAIVFPAIWMGYADMVFKTLGESINPANFAGLPYLWGHAAPANSIREHPDFKGFCDKIGFTQAWATYGWPDVYLEKEHG